MPVIPCDTVPCNPLIISRSAVYNQNGFFGPGENSRVCKVNLGPPEFIFDSRAVQNAANTVYVAKQVYDALPANVASNRVKTFKSDYERMQYKLGLYGRTSTGNA